MATGTVIAVLLLAAALRPPVTTVDRPVVRSAECMSCHDGSGGIAIRQHVSHKVDVVYERIRAGSTAALKPSSAATPFGGSIADALLVEGRVECMTCHYTHEETTASSFRLRIPEGAAQVALCTSCHDMSRL
jgi:hypothetical protein